MLTKLINIGFELSTIFSNRNSNLELKALATDCDFKTVSAEQYKSEMIRNVFINGLQSNNIRQRLLENKTLDLQTAFDQAHSQNVAQQNSTMFLNQVY